MKGAYSSVKGAESSVKGASSIVKGAYSSVKGASKEDRSRLIYLKVLDNIACEWWPTTLVSATALFRGMPFGNLSY